VWLDLQSDYRCAVRQTTDRLFRNFRCFADSFFTSFAHDRVSTLLSVTLGWGYNFGGIAHRGSGNGARRFGRGSTGTRIGAAANETEAQKGGQAE